MRDKENLWVQYDAAIEPAIAALQNFARLYQQCMPDELSINTERWFAGWVAQILSDVGIDLERGAQSLADDGLTWVDGPFQINDPRPERSPDQTNGGKKL
jgi:hypothetical protein